MRRITLSEVLLFIIALVLVLEFFGFHGHH